MSSQFNLLLFYTWIIRFCETLRRGAVRASRLGNFPAYLAFWLLSSAPFFFLLRSPAFCVHLSWQQWRWKWPNGKCCLACLGKKGSVNHNIESFQWPTGLNMYLLCPSLRCSGTPVSSHLGRIWQDMHQGLGVTSLSTTSWSCWCLWQRRMVELGMPGLAMLYQ